MCYCPTPTLHLNLALTGDGAFLLSLKKTHSVWFISVLNYGDTENVLINHLLLVIPMSYPCHYTNLCPHKPHKHAHIHTHMHVKNGQEWPSTADYAAKSLSGPGLKATVWKRVSCTGSKKKRKLRLFFSQFIYLLIPNGLSFFLEVTNLYLTISQFWHNFAILIFICLKRCVYYLRILTCKKKVRIARYLWKYIFYSMMKQIISHNSG